MKIELEIKAYKVTYLCDSCNVGLMHFTGLALMSSPPKYEHKCDSCGKIVNYRVKYPEIVYK